MSLRFPITLTFIFLLVVGAAGLSAFLQQPPTVSVMPANPSTVSVNSTTPVTITAQIVDSRVISNGVSLLAVDPLTSSQTLIGNLVGNGQMFTITVQPNTAAPQLLTYQVSAAFRGILKRSLSLPITVAVAPGGATLPPDPGPAGMATLAGIDTDGDGVRDDIQRWIIVTHSTSSRIRAALYQIGKATQQVILSSSSTQSAAWDAIDRSAQCLNQTNQRLNLSPDVLYKLSQELVARYLNTDDRNRAYFAAEAQANGSMGPLQTLAQQMRTNYCDLDPSVLED